MGFHNFSQVLDQRNNCFQEGFAGEEGTARSDKEPSVVCRVGEEEPGGHLAPK